MNLMNRNFNIGNFAAYVAEGVRKGPEFFRSEAGGLAVHEGSVQPLGEPAAGLVEIVLGNVGKIEHRGNRLDGSPYMEVTGTGKGAFRPFQESLPELIRRLFGKFAELSVDFGTSSLVRSGKILAAEFIEFVFNCSHISLSFKSSPSGEALKDGQKQIYGE